MQTTNKRPFSAVIDAAVLHRTTPPPVDWLVKGLIARGQVTVLAVREGLGKSLFACAFAVQAASDVSELAGFEVAQATSLIVDAENGQDEFHRRLAALATALRPGSIRYSDEVGTGLDLSKQEHRDRLLAVVSATEPDLVVIDSLRTVWRGGELDDAEVTELINSLRLIALASGAAILILHHSPKADGSDYRGTTAIGAAAQIVAVLQRDGKSCIKRRLTVKKCRLGAQQGPWCFAIETDEGRLQIRAINGTSGSGDRTGACHSLAQQIGEAVRQGGPGPLKRASIAARLGCPATDSGFKRALKYAVHEGFVTRVGHGLYGVPPVPLQLGVNGSAGSTCQGIALRHGARLSN